MTDDRRPPQFEGESRAGNDELEQEFYTALRAAGASAEEARSCLQAAVPPATGTPLLP